MSEFDFSLLISEVTPVLSNPESPALQEQALAKLLNALQEHPRGLGAPDAISLIGNTHFLTGDWFRAKISYILAYALRARRVNPYMHFENLVNLALCDLFLRAFDSAYWIAKKAEELNANDPDVLINLAVASHFKGDAADKEKYFTKLYQKYENKIQDVNEGLIKKIENNKQDNKGRSAGCRQKSIRSFRDIRDMLTQLNLEPDGDTSWECWKTLATYYDRSSNSQHNEYLRLQESASLFAAASLATEFSPKTSNSDPRLWKQQIKGLENLSLFDWCDEKIQKYESLAGNSNAPVSLKTGQKPRSSERRTSPRPFKREILGQTVCHNLILLRSDSENELYQIINDLSPILLNPFFHQPDKETYFLKKNEEPPFVRNLMLKWGPESIILQPDYTPSVNPVNCQIGPENLLPEAWVYNALGMENTGGYSPNYRQALDYFEKAIGISPFYFMALYNAANCYKLLGNLHMSLRRYYDARKLSPNDQDILNEIREITYHPHDAKPPECRNCGSHDILFGFKEGSNERYWLCSNCGWSSLQPAKKSSILQDERAQELLLREREQRKASSQAPCFIATTVYGNYQHPQVIRLRRFRDEVLNKYQIGRVLTSLYYKTGPHLSSWIKQHDFTKKIIRIFLDKLIRIICK